MPLVLSTICTLSALSFPFFNILPLIGKPWALQVARSDQGAVLGVIGVVLETAIMMGCLLWIVRRVRLLPGAITAIFVLYSLLIMLVTRNPIYLPIWFIAGVLSDVAMVVLRPSSGEVWRFRVFGALVPALMWSVYYVFFIVTGIGGGIWFTGYVWAGSIVQAAITGYLLAFLMTPAALKQSDVAFVEQEN